MSDRQNDRRRECRRLWCGRRPARSWPSRVHVRNLNPLVAVFGLPAWDTVPIGTRFGVTAEVANHYRFSLRGQRAA